LESSLCLCRADHVTSPRSARSSKKKLEAYAIQADRVGDGLQLDDATSKGLDQILALIHFYLNEEPMLTHKNEGLFDRIALLWNRVQFALQFEDKMRIKTIPKG